MNITCNAIWRHIDLNISYFHPRTCRLPDGPDKLIMTMQTIGGSDYFGPVQFSCSNDAGKSWDQPQMVPGMGRVYVSDNIEEGVCDVVPDFHSGTKTILAIGHNVYYRDGRLYDSLGDWHQEGGPVLQRYIVYSVMDRHGNWLKKRKRLRHELFDQCSMFSCGCSQKVILPDGRILIPVTFGSFGRQDRMVTSLLCEYDGKDIIVLKSGNVLENRVGRGLLEPSIVEYNGKFFMTIRAEDGAGYISVSNNGLDWSRIKACQWENSALLDMSTTQQHWLKIAGRLYLVYTRKNGKNSKVMRWRSPLLIAEFDPDKLCLKKETEKTVFPMRGDIRKPETIGLMGNFHPHAISDSEAIVTVGEMRPKSGFVGDTLLARITV